VVARVVWRQCGQSCGAVCAAIGVRAAGQAPACWRPVQLRGYPVWEGTGGQLPMCVWAAVCSVVCSVGVKRVCVCPGRHVRKMKAGVEKM